MLNEQRLVLVVGKGGVGRSTTAAAIALGLARRGLRTLLIQSSTVDRFGPLWDRPPVGPEPILFAPHLWVVNTHPSAALVEYGTIVLGFQSVANVLFENRLAKGFLRAVPGLDDYAILGKVWYHTQDGRYDRVVFDMPASGHAAAMLRIPRVILESVKEGPLVRDTKLVRATLADSSRTATVLVTLPEELPVNECTELAQRLADEQIVPSHLVINQVVPDRLSPAPVRLVMDAIASANAPPLVALSSAAQLVQARRRLGEPYIERLRQLQLPTTQLPLIYGAELTLPDIERFATLLAA